jgi:hypothetical protein
MLQPFGLVGPMNRSYRMHTLHLDLHLHFLPPMTETGPGIVVTRVIELPFPAADGLRVYSRSFDDNYDPMGFELKEVVWDVDRQVFLADTYYVSHDLPMAFIADEIRAWVGRGWRLGSYRDDYPEPDYGDDDAVGSADTPAAAGDDEQERMHTLPAQRRPKEFNQFLKAMVRHMAETFSNCDAAYAMEKSGRYFREDEVKDRWEEPVVKKWRELCVEFSKLTSEQQLDWRDRTARHPSIEDIILGKTHK